ncbi:hypothetical protein HPSA50_1075 [Helicobacter pylori SouthAfrica50]|uniref:Uncharacterized protein n=1 Tax=Helicobacter pylori SouthAfrica50 TaxID=1352357 RepID=T2S8X9_HELPX|nr:hypothetical protein HPSA50_1075 [Helicobacter pylori SouthAfrica50]
MHSNLLLFLHLKTIILLKTFKKSYSINLIRYNPCATTWVV